MCLQLCSTCTSRSFRATRRRTESARGNPKRRTEKTERNPRFGLVSTAFHMPGTLEEIVKRAQSGDAGAVNDLIEAIQPKMYGLALRMLWHPEDAKDATQEILLRIVTHLATFRGNSSFLTWAYRVGANHLLTWRKSRVEAQGFTFETFGKDLEDGLEDKSRRPEDTLLFQEIRVGCTLGMLICLDRAHRIAYI